MSPRALHSPCCKTQLALVRMQLALSRMQSTWAHMQTALARMRRVRLQPPASPAAPHLMLPCISTVTPAGLCSWCHVSMPTTSASPSMLSV